MKVSRITHIILVILLWQLAPGQAQKVWEKKHYREWSRSDVVRILSDSPWAQTAMSTIRVLYSLPGTSYSVTIRLRSALPIRQAMVRERQLAVKYDKLSDSDKKRFDAETKEFLECSDCAKYYIVTMASYVPVGSPPRYMGGMIVPGNNGVDISEPLRTATLNDLKPHVHLSNDQGQRRALTGYIPPAGVGKEAMFIFPRLDDQGNPLLMANHKTLYFEIDEKVFSQMALPLKKFSFEVRRMVKDDQVLF